MNEPWIVVNQNLIAKAIGELTFEEVLYPQLKDEWVLKLSSGNTYTFSGWMTVWKHLRINPRSLKRNGEVATSAAQFFLDSQSETGMNDITLGNFFEEMNNTLARDLELLNNEASEKLAHLNDLSLQRILNGHPKIILNKGRVGWNEEDSKLYSPETASPFQLRWIGVHPDLIEGEAPSFFSVKEGHIAMPVHPWQWDRYISIQYKEQILNKTIIDYGITGDFYLPQISLRTLSNVTHPEKPDVKLPLSVLNTSCVRGLTPKSVTLGKEVSTVLEKICQSDELLKALGTAVLKEFGGLTIKHPYYSKISDVPYRYNELLGVVYRESMVSKISVNERTILTSVLHHQDENGQMILSHLIRLSGLSTEEWLRRYFSVAVIPLYHLQLEYGVGMVAHGQNIVLKLTDNIPSGILLKDFQGDFRLCSKMTEKGLKHFSHIKDELTKLPPEFLIHDLITGHFITVLRFISGALEESEVIKEKDFYLILGQEIRSYSEKRTIAPEQNLLATHFDKLLLNKVRFKIGYGDSSERPLPMIGTKMRNPLLKETYEAL